MACVDFLDSSAAPLGWPTPRISFGINDRDAIEETGEEKSVEKIAAAADADFEFCNSLRPDDQALPAADELFFQGKIMPLHHHRSATVSKVVSSPQPKKVPAERDAPKMPKCSRIRELLRRSKTSKSASAAPASKSVKTLKHFFRGLDLKTTTTSSSSADADLSNQSLPLLFQAPRDSDADSARMSVSSDVEEIPRRLSFDNIVAKAPAARVNVRRHGSGSARGRSPCRNEVKMPVRGSSVDSPRMNSCGKIIYGGLERSSSSPGAFNGQCSSNRRQRSTNLKVRVAPVLNVNVVPVCSLRGSSSSCKSNSGGKGAMFGFSQLFVAQQQKKDGVVGQSVCSRASKAASLQPESSS